MRYSISVGFDSVTAKARSWLMMGVPCCVVSLLERIFGGGRQAAGGHGSQGTLRTKVSSRYGDFLVSSCRRG